MKYQRPLYLFSMLILATFLSTCASSGATPTSTDEMKITLSTEPNPPQIGSGELVITVMDAAGQPVDDVKVDVSLGMTSMTMNTQDGQANGQGKGQYIRQVKFHTKGEYVVRVWVRRSGKTLKTQDFKFTGG